ncbi:hypothetical protein AWB75_00919 [Caballeronia catudaia]|uniref:Uncharacterized protein n=1 Tax=Caballeronia catudaia TaxID=1777136 RepID=A0A157ZLI0_9BURK|nr:hypothetical protein [Caballeronia catudaia]SAK46368.1 hypothetical protein AWB75_00919 [Caballeronia catudaia]
MSAAFDANALAGLFVEARAHRAKLDALPEGARPDGPIQGAPLPADGMHKHGDRRDRGFACRRIA